MRALRAAPPLDLTGLEAGYQTTSNHHSPVYGGSAVDYHEDGSTRDSSSFEESHADRPLSRIPRQNTPVQDPDPDGSYFSTSSHNPTRVTQAITKAQNLQTLSAEETQMLNQAFTVIWDRIRTQHNYLMTELEWRVFNYFQSRWLGNGIAIQAVARHWEARAAAG